MDVKTAGLLEVIPQLREILLLVTAKRDATKIVAFSHG